MADSPRTWACPGCTFANPLRRRRCEMCECRRPADSQEDTAPSSKKLRREASHSCSADVSPATPAPVAVQPASPAPASLFQTASGKSVGVSAASRRFAQGLLGDDDVPLLPSSPADDDGPRPSSGLKPPARTPGAANRISMTRLSTGSGVATPGAGPSFVEPPRPAMEAPAPRAAPAEAPASFLTMFSFGNGKTAQVSKASFEQAKARLQLFSDDDSDAVKDPTPLQASASPAPNAKAAATPAAVPSQSFAPITLTPASQAPLSTAALARPPTADFVTPSRSTFGARKPFTAPRVSATKTLHSFARPAPAAASAAPSVAADVADARKENAAPHHVAPKKLVKLALDLHSLAGGAPFALPVSLTDVPSHTFPPSACSPALTALFAGGVDGGRPPLVSAVDDACFRRALLTLGALPPGCTEPWVAHHVQLIKLTLLAHALQAPVGPHCFSPLHVLVQLCHRYNVEFVDGRRSILRKLAEKDVGPGAAMVLRIHAVRPDSAAPHTMAVDLSDGWYLATTLFDVPLTQLFRDGVLAVGKKITVCGATSRYETAASPLEIAPGTPLLAVGRNGVGCAEATAALGQLSLAQIPVVPLQVLHPQGGPAAAVDAIVSRILPPYFVENVPDETAPKKGEGDSVGSKQKGGGYRPQTRIIRNAAAHAKFHEAFERRREAAYEQAIVTMSREEAADVMKDRFPMDLSQVFTMLIENGEGEVAAVQLWARRSSCDVDDAELPKEGSRITLFNLTPCRFERCGPPLSCKLLYAHRQLCFQPSKVAAGPSPAFLRHKREIHSAFSLLGDTHLTSRLSLPDLCVVCAGSKPLDARRTAMLVVGAEVNVFGLIEIVSIANAKELLFALPSEGSACIVQCVRFLGRDDTLEHTVFRFDASEYTNIVHRPRNQEAAAAIARLDRSAGTWRSTFDAAKQFLLDDALLQRWGGRQQAATSCAVFEGSAPVMATSSDPGSFRGPHYLMHPNTSQPSSATKCTAARDGAVPSAPSNRPSGRVLFDASPSLPSAPSAPSLVMQQQQPAEVAQPQPVTAGRHLFCNVSPASAVCHVVFGDSIVGSYDIFADEAANTTLRASQPMTPAPLQGYDLCRLVLPVDGGPEAPSVTTHFTGPALDVLLSTACTTAHALLSVCADEDHFMLAVDRGAVLAQLETEEAKWLALLAASVVVPKSLLDDKKRALLVDADSAAAETLSGMQQVDVCAAHLQDLPRWNDAFVSASAVLWWSDWEWRQLQEMVGSGLRDKLFKLTLAAPLASPASSVTGSLVERCFFLRDSCPIGTLF